MNEIVELRSQGMSRARIAKKLGITPAKVRYYEDQEFREEHKQIARQTAKIIRGFYYWAKRNNHQILNEYLEKL